MSGRLSALLPAMIASLSLAPAFAAGADPERSALAFLIREVPAWSTEHNCFSCHNNGDAARALMAARRLGWAIPDSSLADTVGWLSRPEGWDRNGGDGPFSDRRLARLQFTVALASSAKAGDALRRAVHQLAEAQGDDGSWSIDGPDSIGSPATYGKPLATALAAGVLRQVGSPDDRGRIERAVRWLDGRAPRTTLDAASILWSGGGRTAEALELIGRGQSDDGGWGPYPDSPPENFDTAVVVLALSRMPARTPAVDERIVRGRAFLIGRQGPDGAWTETTRPAGGESYAQRLSTTGWATMALLATDPAGPRPLAAGDP